MTEEDFDQLEQDEYENALTELAILLLLFARLRKGLTGELYRYYATFGTDQKLGWLDSNKVVHGSRIRTILFALLSSTVTDMALNAEHSFTTVLTNTIKKEYKAFGLELGSEELEKLLNSRWGADDLNWLTRLRNRRDKLLYDLKKELKLALLRKDSLDDLIVTYTDLLDRFDRYIKTLLTTEQSAMSSRVRLTIFTTMGVEKYKFYTRADERTCDQCGVMHGLIFPITAWQPGVTASPLHTNCRCWEVPVYD